MPFASFNPINPRTNPLNFHKKISRIGDFEKWSFIESAILNFFSHEKYYVKMEIGILVDLKKLHVFLWHGFQMRFPFFHYLPVNLYPLFLFWKHGLACDCEKIRSKIWVANNSWWSSNTNVNVYYIWGLASKTTGIIMITIKSKHWFYTVRQGTLPPRMFGVGQKVLSRLAWSKFWAILANQ